MNEPNKKTWSIFLKKTHHSEHNILHFMSSISKNVYNTTLYCHNIYYKYKNEIYLQLQNLINSKTIITINDANLKIYDLFNYFFNIENSIKNNSILLNEKMKYDLKNITITNNNYFHFSNLLKNKYNDLFIHSNIYEYEYIIDLFLKKRYLYNYMKTVQEIKNKIPISINDDVFINQVKSKQCLFPKVDIKKNIKEFKLDCDEKIIEQFIRKHLNDNYEKLPSNCINNTINKATYSIKSFYAKNEKGFISSYPRYLKKDNLYILQFYSSCFKKLNNNYIKLSVGTYISKHYKEITNQPNLICVNENLEHKLYCKESDMIICNNKQKISKVSNYIVGNKYISKKSDRLIDASYIYVKVGKELYDKDIKLIEINPIYEGHTFKINFTFDEKKKVEKKEKIKTIENSISIDLGMVNLMTIYNPTGKQQIIKGGYIISINNHYNNKIDKLKSKISLEKDKQLKKEIIKNKHNIEIKRSNIIDNYFNKVTKKLYDMYNDTKENIIIGYNQGWKTEVNLGRETNRKFYEIPYKKLINKMKNKFNDKITITEEAYTSKCDSLNLEKIGKNTTYSGKRTERGLFKSKKGLINADLNGAINIMRKIYDMTEIKGENIFNPERLKIKY